MKKRTLLTAVVSMFFVTGAFAQDVTPKNWKFSAMPIGTIDAGVFIKEAARIGGNLSYGGEGGEAGRKGFRRADNMEGAFVVNDWATPDANYEQMTEEQKTMLNNFYSAFQIVDGGALGHILCYQGANSTETDSRAVKNKSAMGGPSLNVFTQKNIENGIYRFSLSVRIVLNKGMEPAKANLYCASSWYDQQNYAGSKNGILFDITATPQFNQYWTTYQYEVEVDKSQFAADYDLLPFNNKIGLGGLANNAIIFMTDIKIEKIPAATLGGAVKIIPEDWSDTPSGIYNVTNNDIIVFGNANGITVVDAKESIEVYSVSGQLIQTATPNIGSSTTIPVSQKGIYIVKVGTTSKKVIL